jgi:hypothetical protein
MVLLNVANGKDVNDIFGFPIPVVAERRQLSLLHQAARMLENLLSN